MFRFYQGKEDSRLAAEIQHERRVKGALKSREADMITIFSTPRPFKENFAVLQKNAIRSWLKIAPKCEIILFEDEDGTTGKIAQDYGLKYIKESERNEFKMSIFSDVLERASKAASFPLIAYVNTDIILFQDFLDGIKKAMGNFDNFLLVGRRRDLDVKEEIDFEDSGWEAKLRDRLKKEGELHHPAAIDYVVIPRELCSRLELPPFIVGRPYWDVWLLYRAKKLGIPIIDGTEIINAVHQNHYRKYGIGISKGHSKEKVIEYKRNYRLLKGIHHALTLKDADWVLTDKGLESHKPIFLISFLHRYSVLFISTYPCFEKRNRILLFPVWLGFIVIREIRKILLKVF